ncbi:PPC domain-containing DNA-binding protein [Methanobacterium aggregans]|uniref:PPC domain-containing DNA-binding protein n=1 Tax=Methanobacterium aggregans TaxID=1615586 RepID=UPI0032111A39
MIVSRLRPGEDLKKGIENIASEGNLKSGVLLCIVGSLNKAVLRMSNENKMVLDGPFEIVSAEGTVSPDGIHVHLAVSDHEGRVFGGHLMKGCEIYTTAEICILKVPKKLKRIFDSETGYKELLID